MIDKRVIERQIRKGKLDAAAYRRTLESLPDVSDRVARDTDIEPPSRPAMSSVASVSAVSSGHEQAAAESESEADDDLDDEDEDDQEDDDEAEDADDTDDAPAAT